jgi:hypothetical protein
MEELHVADFAKMFASNKPAKTYVFVRQLQEFSPLYVLQVVDEPWRSTIVPTLNGDDPLDDHRQSHRLRIPKGAHTNDLQKDY